MRVSAAMSIKLCPCPSQAPAPPAAGSGKETPQERLKRLMQAQLNKAAQKDSLAVAQRKIQVCTGSSAVLQDTACLEMLWAVGGCCAGVWLIRVEWPTLHGVGMSALVLFFTAVCERKHSAVCRCWNTIDSL